MAKNTQKSTSNMRYEREQREQAVNTAESLIVNAAQKSIENSQYKRDIHRSGAEDFIHTKKTEKPELQAKDLLGGKTEDEKYNETKKSKEPVNAKSERSRASVDRSPFEKKKEQGKGVDQFLAQRKIAENKSKKETALVSLSDSKKTFTESGSTVKKNDSTSFVDNMAELPGTKSKILESPITTHKAVVSDDGKPVLSLNDKGFYNTANKDFSGAGEVVSEVADGQAQQTDAGQAKREISDKAELYGAGTLSRMAQKKDVTDYLYNRKYAEDKKYTEDIYKAYKEEHRKPFDSTETRQAVFGNNYHIGANITGNAIKDYRTNVEIVERYLQQHYHINAKNLSLREIESGLAKGRLEHWHHWGGKIVFDNYKGVEKANLYLALNELKYLRGQQNKVKQYMRSGGGLVNTGKAWIRQGTEDSDAAKGYETANIAYRTGNAALWATKGVINAGVSITAGATDKTSRVIFTNAEEKAKRQAKWATDPVMKQKYQIKAEEYASKRAFISDKTAEVQQWTSNVLNKTAGEHVKSAVESIPIGLKKEGDRRELITVGDKVKEKRDKYLASKVHQTLTEAEKRVASSTAVKIASAPLEAINYISGIASTVAMIIGIVLLSILLIAILSGLLLSMFPSLANEVDDSNIPAAQMAINDMYETQEAYGQNIHNAEVGSIYANKPIPDSWHIDEITVTDINNNVKTYNTSDPKSGFTSDVIVMDGGTLIGYNFSKYFGPDDPDSMISYTCDNVGFNGYSVPMTITGAKGGLVGNIGDYTTSSPGFTVDGFGPGASITVPIDAAYNNPVSPTPANVEIKYIYMGSEKSDAYTTSRSLDYSMRDGINGPGGKKEHSIESLYKGIMCCAIAYTGNRAGTKDSAFVTKYCDHLFDKVMEKADVKCEVTCEKILTPNNVSWTMTDDDGTWTICTCPAADIKVDVLLTVTLDHTGIQDIMKLDDVDDTWSHTNGSVDAFEDPDPSSPTYVKWKGWFSTDPDVDHNNDGMNDNQDMAIWYYELNEEDWETFFQNISLPGNPGVILTDDQINDILSQISCSSERETFLRYALSCIGKSTYKFGSGHPAVYIDGGVPKAIDVDTESLVPADYVPNTFDCSGFVSYALWRGGADPHYKARTASVLKNEYTPSSFNGNYNSIQPGTLIIKDNSGTEQSPNHVCIYLGKVSIDGKPERYYCIECTVAEDDEGVIRSGTQLSSSIRMDKYIKKYKYKTDPF